MDGFCGDYWIGLYGGGGGVTGVGFAGEVSGKAPGRLDGERKF